MMTKPSNKLSFRDRLSHLTFLQACKLIAPWGRELIQQWWISTFPGLAIFSVAMACNFVGDGLRDAIDPRLRVR